MNETGDNPSESLQAATERLMQARRKRNEVECELLEAERAYNRAWSAWCRELMKSPTQEAT